MKLVEALQLGGKPLDLDQPTKTLALVCGFTPLHLETFLLAYARSGRNLKISSGLYGDLLGNLDRAGASSPDFAAVVLEWADLDPRLGLRSSGGWLPETLPSIVDSVRDALQRIEYGLARLAEKAPVALSPPTLPLPPVAHTAGWQASGFVLSLEALLAGFLERAANLANVHIVSRQRLEEVSPAASRLDPRMELGAGFPYTSAHADAVAKLLWTLLDPPAPKKGLITDLDNTFWSGILGEVGVEGVTWSQEDHTQIHGLYQQMLASLAASGVLVGVASKNDAALVQDALGRSDLLTPLHSLFPVEAHWGPKSESVARILEAWNIGVDSVVFVDDSALELAEVQTRFPAITALQFPSGNRPDELWKLLWQLRDLFGRPQILEEDRLRAGSLRAATHFSTTSTTGASPAFIASVEPEITLDFSKTTDLRRAFELVNKTNQFNLNGRRLTESDWKKKLEDPDGFLLTVSYQDKFGPLGRIAVALGRKSAGVCFIDAWVLSCRAFSRLIEHQILRHLFSITGAGDIVFDYNPTARNGPLQEFFSSLFGAQWKASEAVPEGLRLSLSRFEEICPELPHRIKETAIASH